MGVAAMDFAKWGLGIHTIEGILVFSLKIIIQVGWLVYLLRLVVKLCSQGCYLHGSDYGLSILDS